MSEREVPVIFWVWEGHLRDLTRNTKQLLSHYCVDFYESMNKKAWYLFKS